MLARRRTPRGESDPLRLACACDNSGTVVLFYKYVALSDPVSTARKILDESAKGAHSSVKGKIRIAREGINATFAASKKDDVEAFIEFLESLPELTCLRGTDYKREPACSHAFGTLSVRVTEELCPFGEPDLSTTVDSEIEITSLTPSEWDAALRERNDEESTVLDVRNFYESRVGHFDGSVLAPIRRFSQLKEWLARDDALDNVAGRDVYIFCTGGVRCEKAATYLCSKLPADRRPRSVRKLEGGIVAYARDFASSEDCLFKGSNYVFDARGSVSVSDDLPSTSRCDGCDEQSGRLSKCVGRNCHVVLIACETCGDTVYCCESCREQTERAVGIEKFKRRSCECDCFESRIRRCRTSEAQIA